jgi:hypothetical protein
MGGDEIFAPPGRTLTEEQFQKIISNNGLSHADVEFLRRSCGLPYDIQVISREPLTERATAIAWQKIRGNPFCPRFS